MGPTAISNMVTLIEVVRQATAQVDTPNRMETWREAWGLAEATVKAPAAERERALHTCNSLLARNPDVALVVGQMLREAASSVNSTGT